MGLLRGKPTYRIGKHSQPSPRYTMQGVFKGIMTRQDARKLRGTARGRQRT